MSEKQLAALRKIAGQEDDAGESPDVDQEEEGEETS